ncbi:MAG: hypothetical protein R2747_06240 [Pyrinomonadaceae bacterium]
MRKIIFCLIFICPPLFTEVKAQTNIRAIDFQNFTYQPLCGGTEPQNFSVKNGSFYEETLIPVQPDDNKKKKVAQPTTKYDRKFFNVFQTNFGDVTGDGNDEAILLTVCSKNGPETFTEGFIYGINDGVPELLARIPGGDRAADGIRTVSVENGTLIVERSDPGDSIEACCPEMIATSRYRFENNNLNQIGETVKREIYPPTRIQFTEGTDRTSFDLSIPKDSQINRFMISGKKGQTLRVYTTNDLAKIRLKRGLAKLETDPKPIKKLTYYTARNSLIAKLKETGDFVFEITNFSKTDLNVTVTIEIN